MARWAHADTLDGSLNVIKNNCTKLAVVAALLNVLWYGINCGGILCVISHAQ